MWRLLLLSCFTYSFAKPSVLIIGAGPAGIAAATKLLENFFDNITILEAETRTGGRIYSTEFIDGIVDVGAQYCHGEKGNIAYELAKDFNVLEPGLRGLQNNVYYSNGSRLDHDFIEELKEIYLNYYKADGFNTTEKATGDLILYKYKKIFDKYRNDNDKIKLLSEGVSFLEGYVIIHEGVFSWYETSAESDYEHCEGNQALTWKGLGYKTVLDIMTKSYPDPSKKLPIGEKTILNAPVEKIFWNISETILVQTFQKNYTADYVIFTPSIGVLKQRKHLFDPLLPFHKQNSIQATGFHGVMKIFLYFSENWWNDKDNAFAFFWNEKDKKHLNDSWITQFRYILKVPHNNNVWVGWVSGPLVPETELLPLETVKDGISKVLNRFLGERYNITEITKILRSNWCTNPNFGGTYSSTRKEFYKKGFSHQQVLAEPLVNVQKQPLVLFAGEATHPTHYSTVHGAIESGYREARRIISLHKNDL